MESAIEEYWVDLRRGRSKAKRLAPSFCSPAMLSPLVSWAKQLYQPDRVTTQVLPGDYREGSLKLIIDELPQEVLVRAGSLQRGDDPMKMVLHTIRDMKVPSRNRTMSQFEFLPPHPAENPFGWDLLWCLVACNEVTLPAHLRDLVNRRSRMSDFYRALVEIRFEAREKHFFPAIEENVIALSQWVEGQYKEDDDHLSALLQKANIKSPVRTEERFELLLFILTLAQHNRLLDDLIVYLDQLDQLSTDGCEQLLKMVGAVDRWAHYGCPMNLLLGWRGSKEDLRMLRSQHARLAARLREGMEWTQRV